ncbi:hypothetical protein BWI97_25290 [Siphonobacter sp. BAB-5405]|uniref:outer membrane beta-barrel protein n=1 Tax=Siphonobacter sp. BAB-5405 TaxID=1864825 RepID=UPI000C7FF264|nr:outer membrane beta-barrel protein [Siphonobacter sp. BAB-5405]PMD88528.1 hypothetical protein BWI97_25290 [Siphonobacter sp. BAB-5405]
MANVAVSQGLPNSLEQYSGYTNSSGISVDGLLASAMAEFSPLAEVLEANAYEVVATNVKHKTPLTAVLSFQYQLSQRLSLTTGLTYTRLESDLRSGSLASYLNREQTLHYAGVPLQLNYQMLTRGRFSGYVAMGGQVRKAVYGTLKTTYTVNAEKRTESVETLEERPWDFSVNAAAGLQYTLTPGLSLFIEPGLEYHVHRPTTIPTIYQEQPLLFNAHFGLRFKLK